MRKTFILAIALSLVLLSGGLSSAQACFGCLNPCGWRSACADTETTAAALDFNWRPNLDPCTCGLHWLSPCCWHLSSPCNWCGGGQAAHAQEIDKPLANKVGNGSIGN